MSDRNDPNRRDFIHTSCACLAGAGLLAKSSLGWSANTEKKPVIACRDANLGEVKAASPWEAMKAIGVEGVEVYVDFDRSCPGVSKGTKKYSIGSAEGIADLRNDVTEQGVQITSFCLGNHFDERPEEEVAFVSDVVLAAKQLNAKVIRIDVVPRRLKDRANFLRFSTSICRQLVDLVKGTEIRYGIENHGDTTNDPEFLDKLFDGVGSDALGLTLDTGNFYWFGHPLEDLYKIYEKYAPRVYHTHCKSINYPDDKQNIRREIGWEYGKYCCPIYEGDIDFKKVVAILRAAGYSGDYCIENESLERFPQEERGAILKKEAELLRSLV
ncbi:MAG TPA: sugar phosphate isomerase/epimerase family protein [bacterium]|nr:sugar phosphate isomerase/epimerase family protein [bacterium]HQL61642.1 sugar phosphate isomerase/epimerase family protein [bacterium]